MITLKEPLQFEWDLGNQDKNWKKHHVSMSEAEEIFFDGKKRILKDFLHSTTEIRYLLIGKTKLNRALFIVFTKRGKHIRIISARDLNKKEQVLLKK